MALTRKVELSEREEDLLRWQVLVNFFLEDLVKAQKFTWSCNWCSTLSLTYFTVSSIENVIKRFKNHSWHLLLTKLISVGSYVEVKRTKNVKFSERWIFLYLFWFFNLNNEPSYLLYIAPIWKLIKMTLECAGKRQEAVLLLFLSRLAWQADESLANEWMFF